MSELVVPGLETDALAERNAIAAAYAALAGFPNADAGLVAHKRAIVRAFVAARAAADAVRTDWEAENPGKRANGPYISGVTIVGTAIADRLLGGAASEAETAHGDLVAAFASVAQAMVGASLVSGFSDAEYDLWGDCLGKELLARFGGDA